MAWRMLAICMATAPVLFAGAGAPCAGGACPEGKMSCKRATDMKRITKELGAVFNGRNPLEDGFDADVDAFIRANNLIIK